MRKHFCILILGIIIPTVGRGQINTSAKSQAYILTEQGRDNYVLSINQKNIKDSGGGMHNYYDRYIDHNKYGFTYVSLKLTNNSNDTLKYARFSCSWTDIYGTDSKYILVLLNRGCPKNLYGEEVIPPHQSLITNIPVIFIKVLNGLNNRFRIGMHLQLDDRSDLNFRNDANTIWSNEVQIGL